MALFSMPGSCERQRCYWASSTHVSSGSGGITHESHLDLRQTALTAALITPMLPLQGLWAADGSRHNFVVHPDTTEARARVPEDTNWAALGSGMNNTVMRSRSGTTC